MHENLWQSPTTVKWIWLTCWYRFSNWLTVNCSGKTTSCMTGGGSGLGERNTFNSYMGKKIKLKFSPNIKSAKISTDSKERFCISLTVLMRKSSCWRTSSCFSFCRFSMAKRIASDIWSMLHRKSNNHIRLLLTFTCYKSWFFFSFLRNINFGICSAKIYKALYRLYYLSISFKNLAPSQSIISLYVLSALDFRSCNTLIPWTLINSNLFLAAVSVTH